MAADDQRGPPERTEAPMSAPTPPPTADETEAGAPQGRAFPPEQASSSAPEPQRRALSRGSPSDTQRVNPTPEPTTLPDAPLTHVAEPDTTPPSFLGRSPPRRDGATVLALSIALIAASLIIAYLPSLRTNNLAQRQAPTAEGLVAAATAAPAQASIPTASARLQGAVAGRGPTDGTTTASAVSATSPTMGAAKPTVAPSAAAATAPTATPLAIAAIPVALPTATVNPLAPLAVVAAYTVGQNLCDLAVDARGQNLYVTDDGPEQLLVLDGATGQPTRRYDLHDSLCSIALDELGRTVYAPTWHRAGPGRYDSSQIQAIQLDTSVITTFADDQFPSGPLFDPQRRVLYAGNTAQPTLVSIDTTSRAVLSLPATARINRVAVSSKNGRLYLVSPEDNTVLVYDLAVGKVVTTLTVGQRPWGVVADPATGRVLVSSELSGGVSLLDPTTNAIVRTTATGSHPRNVAVDAAHGHFVVLNTGDRTVSVLSADGALLSTSASMPGGEPVRGIAVADQSGQVFVVSTTHMYALR